MKKNKTSTSLEEIDFENLLENLRQNCDVHKHFAKIRTEVEKVIADRRNSSYVPDEKLQAVITV